MPDLIKQLAQNKLIILRFVQKTGVSLTNNEISQFLLDNQYMDYFSAQQYMAELVDAGWLDYENGRYTLTDEGDAVIYYFQNHVKEDVKNEINDYVKEHSHLLRPEYAQRAKYVTTANYFLECNGDYLVKCALCDGVGQMLMEVNVSVISLAQAQRICKNWRKHVNRFYGSFLSALAQDSEIDLAKEILHDSPTFSTENDTNEMTTKG